MEIKQEEKPDSGKWGAMLAVGLCVIMATLDTSIVNISLPTLVEELETNFATIQWVILSYVLVLTSLTLGVGRLGDMLGKKIIFMAGLVVFTTGSLLCGLSPGVGWLIGFRALQGVGAVMVQALGTAIVTEVFPASERGRALGIIGGTVSVGLALGPPIGGIIIGLLGWRWVFWVNVPLGAIAFVAALKYIPPLLKPEKGQHFDAVGALIMMVTLVTYGLGMTLGQHNGFDDGLVLTVLAAALGGLIIFSLVEIRTRQPMLDPALFKNIYFTINLIMGFLTFIVVSGTFVIPFYLELVKGYPPEKVGLLMMVVPVTMGLVAPAAGVLSDRFGSRGISVLGLIVVVGGCLAMSSLDSEVTEIGYILRLAPMGLGMGLFLSPNNSAVMGAVARERLGVASGLLALTRTMGHTTGLPLMGAIFTTMVLGADHLTSGAEVTSASPQALVAGISGTFYFAAISVGLATLLAAMVFFKSRQGKSAADSAQ